MIRDKTYSDFCSYIVAYGTRRTILFEHCIVYRNYLEFTGKNVKDKLT